MSRRAYLLATVSPIGLVARRNAERWLMRTASLASALQARRGPGAPR